MIQFVTAQSIHVMQMVPFLRPIDRREWTDMGDQSKGLYEKVFGAVWGTKHVHTALLEERPVAIFGCTPQEGFAAPWLLGTPELEKIGKTLVHFGRVYTDVWAGEYGQLHNLVHAENTVAIRWLEAIGYHVSPIATPQGANNEPYRLFSNHV